MFVRVMMANSYAWQSRNDNKKIQLQLNLYSSLISVHAWRNVGFLQVSPTCSCFLFQFWRKGSKKPRVRQWGEVGRGRFAIFLSEKQKLRQRKGKEGNWMGHRYLKLAKSRISIERQHLGGVGCDQPVVMGDRNWLKRTPCSGSRVSRILQVFPEEKIWYIYMCLAKIRKRGKYFQLWEFTVK